MADLPTLGTWFSNPVFQRETQGSARRIRTYGVRILYGIVIAIALWILRESVAHRRFVSTSEFAQVGRDLYWTFFSIQTGFVTLAAVIAAADMILRESKADTLGILSLTMLSPFQIVAGKWLAAMAQPVMLILCGAPVLAAAAYLGGVGPSDVLRGTLLGLASAALAGAYAVWLSAHFRSALTVAFTAILAYLGHALMASVAGLLLASFDPSLAWIFHPLVCSIGGVGGEVWVWFAALGIALGFAGLILRAAAARLAHVDALLPPAVQLSQDIESRRSYATVASENLGFKWKDRPVSERHPLLWKEVRTRPASHLSCEARLFVLILSSLGALGFLFVNDVPFTLVPWLLVALLSVLAVPAGAALFNRDREARRWEPILVSPVRPREIVQAKLASTFVSPEGLTLLLQSAACMVALMRFFPPLQAAKMAATIGLFLTTVYVFSAAVSLFVRGFRTALAVGTITPILFLVGLPGLDRMFVGRSPRPEEIALTRLFHPFEQFQSDGMDGFFLVYCAAYLGVMGVLYGLMVRRFDKAAGRA